MQVRCVPLATLNPSRMELLVKRYLEQLEQGRQQGGGAQQKQQGQQRSSHHKWSPGHAVLSGSLTDEGQLRTASKSSSGSSSSSSSSSSDSGSSSGSGSSSSGDSMAEQQASRAVVQLPTPAELAAHDPVFHTPWVCVGTPLSKLVRQHGSQLGELLEQQVGRQQQDQQDQGQQQWGTMGGKQEGQGVDQQQPALHSQGQGQQQQYQQEQEQQEQQLHMLVPAGTCMHLLLHERATAADCILGFIHAFVLQHGTSGSMARARSRSSSSCSNLGATGQAQSAGGDSGSPGAASTAVATASSSSSSPEQLRSSLKEARRLLPGLLAALEAAGWDDEKVVLEAKRRRVTW